MKDKEEEYMSMERDMTRSKHRARYPFAAVLAPVVLLVGCHTSPNAQNVAVPAPPGGQMETDGTDDVASRASWKYRRCVLAAKDDAESLERCLIDELVHEQRAVGRIFYDIASRLDGERLDALHAQQRAWQRETDEKCSAAKGDGTPGPPGTACRTARLIGRFEELSRQRSEIGVSSWSEVQPDDAGKLVMVLDDFRVAMQSQGCETDTSTVICSDVRLTVAAPGRSPQILASAQVVLPRRTAPLRPAETGVRGPLDKGFVEGRHGLMLTDLNVDGHDDLMVWTGFDGTYGDPSYTYFIYDPAAGKLVENTAIAEAMMAHSLSRIVDGQLFAWYRSGPCERGEKTIDVRGAAPRIVARRDYNTCEGDRP